jgi:hypothetical protein
MSLIAALAIVWNLLGCEPKLPSARDVNSSLRPNASCRTRLEL